MNHADDPWRSARKSMAALETSGTTPRSLLGFTALSVSVVLAVLVAFLLGVNMHRLRDSFAWVQHTNRVLLEAAGMHEALLEAGSATRSYLLTGDPTYIAVHAQAIRAMNSRLDVLARLVSDNPAQARRVAEFRSQIRARQLALARAGGLNAGSRERVIATMRAVGNSGAYRDFSVLMGAKFDAFRQQEMALLQMRQDSAEKATGLTALLAILAAALALIAGGAGVYLIQRERAEHRAREMELLLTHTQRLSLMGETSLALAHELNQPLSAAGNYLSALKRFLASETGAGRDRADDTAEKARAQVLRAGEIVKRLRNFVAHGDNERSPQTVETLFADALALLGTLDEGVALNRSIEPGLRPVFVDRIQVQQVLVNLMRNAIEAMRNSPKRELTLRAIRHDANTVQICLQDSGSGLPPDIASRLFKPFVTTKSTGMGVGLSISQRIVLDHGGRIWAESIPGQGALFCFTLPVAQAEEAAAA
ncbi:MAG: CHASE3 domain-containing protein [Alphaproteobacteria bacterium]|nr:CHASE3 domain-containing protein [Alphaproteobacteria bacterium]